MSKEITLVLMLKKRTPTGIMRVGNYQLKHNRPQAVCFTEKDYKIHIKGQKKTIEHFFDVGEYEGKEKLKAGDSIDLKGPDPELKKEGTPESPDAQELDEILEGGDPEILAAFIKNKGVDSVPNNTLKAVLSSLKVEMDGRKSYSNTELNQMLVKHVETSKEKVED